MVDAIGVNSADRSCLTHGAGWRARPGLAGPAALLQDPGLEQSGLTGVAVDVPPAVTSGQDAVRARLVVAVAVAPALLVRVRELAVGRGLAATARVISAAAAIMVVVFLSFVLTPDVSVKQIGLGLAAAPAEVH